MWKSIAFIVAMLATGISFNVKAHQMYTELDCLALNIYHEARGEGRAGMIAVAEVTIRRTLSKRFPNTICKVVKQRNQFSWYWDGKSDHPLDEVLYADAQKVAAMELTDYWRGFHFTGNALFYINPKTASFKGKEFFSKLTLVMRLGNHEFYE